MAMTDYPMEASFLEHMPAYPINVSCNAFADWTVDNTTDEQVLNMLNNAA